MQKVEARISGENVKRSCPHDLDHVGNARMRGQYDHWNHRLDFAQGVDELMHIAIAHRKTAYDKVKLVLVEQTMGLREAVCRFDEPTMPKKVGIERSTQACVAIENERTRTGWYGRLSARAGESYWFEMRTG